MYKELLSELDHTNTSLVAVSKTKANEQILELYQQGQRIFGENRVQELVQKSTQLPTDIHWHFIGSLQRKKVKQLVPLVSLIHSVDSIALLEKIESEAEKINRHIDVLLQFHIATETTKQGLELNSLSEESLSTITALKHVQICGVMGMASFVDDKDQIRKEFRALKEVFNQLKKTQFAQEEKFQIISMGMSGDYKIAIEEGANMVRIGSLLFGAR